MLEILRIENFALIESIEIEFLPGFNVLTGETGAGKSILVGALNLVLGARASSDTVRQGADKARVEAVFRLNQPAPRLARLLEDADVPLDEGTLYLARVVKADGRSRAYAGGRMVPVHLLAAIGDELVDLHGQHEHQSLLHADCQLDLLDAFGGLEEEARQLAGQVTELRNAERELTALEQDDREMARQMDYLRHAAGEIAEAALEPGEEEQLRARRNLITNAEAVRNLAAAVYAALYENESGAATDLVGHAERELEELTELDARFQEFATRLTEARDGIEAVAQGVRSAAEEVEYDPDELEALNQRLALLGNLKRKYGDTLEEILAFQADAQQRADAYSRRDERLAALRAERDKLHQEAATAARALRGARKRAAENLDKQVAATLQELGMKGARFSTSFEEGELTSRGLDRVAFLLSANPGEPLKALKQVASGGEVSRIMLALKAVFAHADRIPTLVFDEIDAGVGGAVARKVAAKVAALGLSHQVLCITHIPQIAAGASAHFTVQKRSVKGRTSTEVYSVRTEARVREVARLLDGTVSEVSLEHARELLAGQKD